MKNFLKIASINFLILFLFILIFELVFGYFLKKNNFGYLMRSERQKNEIYEVIHNNQKYKFNYKRNFYGFRGEEVDPLNIKLVFEGGSTGNQKFTPQELTIVGQLNKKLTEVNYKYKIINASTDGKTLKGYANDFKYWFPKINNFKPKYMIFYTGINDSNLNQEDKYDLPWREGTSLKINDYIKNNSKLVELFKKVKYKYFNNQIRKEYGVTKQSNKLYENFFYVNYETAKIRHIEKKSNEQLIKQLQNRLNNLKYYIDKFDIVPIFITQIKFDGLNDYNLFQVNEHLKVFCKRNQYYIIKLDEILTKLEEGSFYDQMHTTPAGNRFIAEKIFPELYKILK